VEISRGREAGKINSKVNGKKKEKKKIRQGLKSHKRRVSNRVFALRATAWSMFADKNGRGPEKKAVRLRRDDLGRRGEGSFKEKIRGKMCWEWRQ